MKDGREHSAWTGWKAWAYAFLHRNPASSRAVVEWAQLRQDMQVLDIGCGSGAAVLAAAPLLVEGAAVGVDPSPDFVRIARRRARRLPNASFEIAPAEQLPFADARFDVAWSVHATHHWDDIVAGLNETERVLRPGGTFLVVERDDAKEAWGISKEEAEALAGTLAEVGFVNVRLDERAVGRSHEYLITGETSASTDEPSLKTG